MPSTTGYSHLQAAPSGRMSHSGRRGPITSSSPLVFSRLSSVIGGSHNPDIILAARQPLRSAIAAADRGIAPRIGIFPRTSAPTSTGRMNDLPQVICPSGALSTGVSSPISKNISLHASGKSSLQVAPSHPTRGALAIVTNAGWVAVDAAAFCARWDRRAGRKTCERSPAC